ncbi:MAG TPA: TlpA disulfide reductase family protein [Thermoanaerobaculia bacterium]
MRTTSKVLVLVALLALAACRREHRAQPKVQANAEKAGAQTLTYESQWLDGSKFDLAREKGNVVLLNVWATWCGPCRFEIPELDKLHAQYASRGFKVIGVSIDEGGASDVKPFLKDQKVSYPIAVDPEGKLATMLKTTVIPTSVLIDRGGKIVWKHFGIVSTGDESLTKALEAALGQSGRPPLS